MYNLRMRRMLGAPSGVAIAGMRGEIGMSTVRSRLARGRIQYIRRVEQGKNETLKRLMIGTREGRGSWMRESRKYMEWAGITDEEIGTLTRDEVKRRVGRVVDREWREEMETKSSLRIYRKYKEEMREEDYGGGPQSRFGLVLERTV